MLVVSGEAGVGKTALMDDAAEPAQGMRVVRTVGVESETTMPFGALFDVCRPFLDSIGELPERQRQALAGALALGPAAGGDQFAIGAATLTLLAAGARDTPLLLVVDDAQWLDDASAASLAFALRRFDAEDIAVLIGLRTGEPGGFDVTGFPVLELDRLSAADAVALAAWRRPMPADQAERIARASGGNPLAVLELVASDADGMDWLPIPAHVERTFAARVAELSDETRSAMLVAAIDDLGSLDVIGRATSLGAFDAAQDAGLVRIAGSRLEFRHPLVRSAVYQDASPTERRTAHAALAAALPEEEASRRVWHRAASQVEPDESIAQALDDVAVDAQARRGPSAAAAAWRRAAELTPETGARARRFLAASEAASNAGSSDAASRAAEAALAACEEPLLHADIVRARARIRSQTGGAAEDVSAMLEAEAEAVAPLDSSRAAYLLAAAVTAFWPAWTPRPGWTSRGRPGKQPVKPTTPGSTTSWALNSPAMGRWRRPRGCWRRQSSQWLGIRLGPAASGSPGPARGGAATCPGHARRGSRRSITPESSGWPEMSPRAWRWSRVSISTRAPGTRPTRPRPRRSGWVRIRGS